MIRIVIFHHEVSGIFVYVVVYGTNEEHTCSCTISLHHIALHIILGCRRLLAATVPVHHCTLPEEEYDAASYLVGYGGSGHGICIAFMVIYNWSIGHLPGCGYEVLYFMVGFVFLFHIRVDILKVSYLCLIFCLMNLYLNNSLKQFACWDLFSHPFIFLGAWVDALFEGMGLAALHHIIAFLL
jgi:hypothetical protein